MQNEEEIIVTICEGKVEVDVVGGSGSGCTKLLEPFDELGTQVDSGFKPEYYKRNNTTVQQHVNIRR